MPDEDDRDRNSRNDRSKKPRPITADWLFRAGAHYLERYASSRENLRRVLERKVRRRADALGEPAEPYAAMVEAAVERFVDLKLIDDRSFAEGFLQTQRRRGTSQRMAAAKLSAKGVEREMVETLLTGDEEAERAAAHAYARRRRLGPHRIRDREEKRERDVAAMMRAGFAYGHARSAIEGDEN